MAKRKTDTAAGDMAVPVTSEAETRLEQIKLDLIASLKQQEHDLPYLARAAGCTSTRDYLQGRINETRMILKKHFGYGGE